MIFSFKRELWHKFVRCIIYSFYSGYLMQINIANEGTLSEQLLILDAICKSSTVIECDSISDCSRVHCRLNKLAYLHVMAIARPQKTTNLITWTKGYGREVLLGFTGTGGLLGRFCHSQRFAKFLNNFHNYFWNDSLRFLNTIGLMQRIQVNICGIFSHEKVTASCDCIPSPPFPLGCG